MLTYASSYISKKLNEFIVGQESAVEDIASAVCENFEAFALQKDIKPHNILLMGPTGSGKTQISRSISKVLDVPFVQTCISDYTLTGYKGRDVQEIVAVDFKKALTPENLLKLSQMARDVLVKKKAIEILKKAKPSPLEFLVGLEFCAATVFLSEDEVIEELFNKFGKEKWVEETVKNLKWLISYVIEGDFVKFNQKSIYNRPFGIVFIDEIDKILIDERDGDSESFYRPLQNFILAMVEGTVVTHEEGKIDTTFLTFILSGSFSQSSPDELIPELKGRLDVKAKVRKLGFRDYLEILKRQRFEIPEVIEGILVDVKESALVEIARVCEELNNKEYLGARRLKEIVSQVNRVLKVELKDINALPITVNDKFVRWAVSFKLSKELLTKTISKPIEDVNTNLKEKLRDALVKELVKNYENLMKERGYKLSQIGFFGINPEHIFKKDSTGKSVLEYLIERGAIKKISRSSAKVIKENLGEEVFRRIKEQVKLYKETDV
ncbi:AAA family ATPase [Thermovibrio sp.]